MSRVLARHGVVRDAERPLTVVVDGNENFADRHENVRDLPTEARRLAWACDARILDVHIKLPLVIETGGVSVDVKRPSPLNASSQCPHPLALSSWPVGDFGGGLEDK